ncbi:hypothetical protein TNCV_4891461 [Trichonephila clavipes]|nr:hypothetical protein TNCV_4891461 [Trichonephila clavipes]
MLQIKSCQNQHPSRSSTLNRQKSKDIWKHWVSSESFIVGFLINLLQLNGTGKFYVWSFVAVNAYKVRPNSQAVQLTVPYDPRYARLVTKSVVMRRRQSYDIPAVCGGASGLNPIVLDITPNEGEVGWVSLGTHVMGTAIPNVLQPGALRCFGKIRATSEGAAGVWTAANEAVGSTRECRMM